MLTIDEIEVLERDAKDEYVDEYGAGSYCPEVTKLCADWRELTAQLQASKTDYEDMREAWREDEKRITALTGERDGYITKLSKTNKMFFKLQRQWDSLYAQYGVIADERQALDAKCLEVAAAANAVTEQLKRDEATIAELQEKLVKADAKGIETCSSCEASLDVVSLSAKVVQLKDEWLSEHALAETLKAESEHLVHTLNELAPQRDDAINAVIEMVAQHCAAGTGGVVYHTFELSANECAMDFLVKMGLMTKHKGGYTFSGAKLAALADKEEPLFPKCMEFCGGGDERCGEHPPCADAAQERDRKEWQQTTDELRHGG